MTREEYMKKLNEALSVLPEKTQEAARNFCEEMLDDRMEDGMDEESAVAAMESPEAIALRLGSEPGESIDMGNLKLPNRDDYLQFARLADEALEGVDKALRDVPEPEKEENAAPEAPEAPEAPKDAEFKEAPGSSVPPVPPVPPAPPMQNIPENIRGIVENALEAARQGLEMGSKAMREAGQQAQQSAQSRSGCQQKILKNRTAEGRSRIHPRLPGRRSRADLLHQQFRSLSGPGGKRHADPGKPVPRRVCRFLRPGLQIPAERLRPRGGAGAARPDACGSVRAHQQRLRENGGPRRPVRRAGGNHQQPH